MSDPAGGEQIVADDALADRDDLDESLAEMRRDVGRVV
jgi:hypothetical protein